MNVIPTDEIAIYPSPQLDSLCKTADVLECIVSKAISKPMVKEHGEGHSPMMTKGIE